MRDRKSRSGPKQSSHHRILRMRMNTAPRVPQLERIPEKRRARRLLQVSLSRPSEEHPVGMRRGCRLGSTKMCVGSMRSFCTPEGAMKTASLCERRRIYMGGRSDHEKRRILCECRFIHQPAWLGYRHRRRKETMPCEKKRKVLCKMSDRALG